MSQEQNKSPQHRGEEQVASALLLPSRELMLSSQEDDNIGGQDEWQRQQQNKDAGHYHGLFLDWDVLADYPEDLYDFTEEVVDLPGAADVEV